MRTAAAPRSPRHRSRSLQLTIRGLLLGTGLLLAACDRPASRTDRESTLVVSLQGEPDSLDPARAYLKTAVAVVQATHESLTRPDPIGDAPLPGVAERWEASADHRVWTFYLRHDARWSDGSPVVAEDFVRTLQTLADPARPSPNVAHLYNIRGVRARATGQAVATEELGIRAVATDHLELHLVRPDAFFPQLTWAHFWAPTPPPRKPGLPPPVNGPYVPKAREGSSLRLERNPYYWARDRVHLERLRFEIFDTAAADERAFRSGQVNVTDRLPWLLVNRHAGENPPVLHRWPIAQVAYVAINTRRPSLRGRDIRRALSRAIDREAIVRHVTAGGERPAYRFTPPLASAEIPAPAPTVPARAAAHETPPASASRPPELVLAITGDSALAEALQERWRKALGLRVRIEPRDGAAHYARLRSGDFDLALAGYFNDLPGLGALDVFRAGDPNNVVGWSSASYDAALDRALLAIEPAARDAAIAAAEDLLADDVPAFPLYFGAGLALVDPRLRSWTSDRYGSHYYLDLDFARSEQ